MPDITGSFRSFPEARTYFERKLNLPTARWDELWQAQHAQAFTVAGATKADLLEDLRKAVQAAIGEGETIADFRARFDEIVAKHGWTGWTGSETPARKAWRTSVIYHTNLRTSYQAGRWETLKGFPYLKYIHNTVGNPRQQHLQWNGLVLRADDPWWKTNYPPNGWGCRCTVTGVSAARLRVMGKSGPDATPQALPGDPPPEWAYHVGEASQS